jgi:hypothetical protein
VSVEAGREAALLPFNSVYVNGARPRYDFEPLYERAREGEIQVWDILVLAWDILVFETADDGAE